MPEELNSAEARRRIFVALDKPNLFLAEEAIRELHDKVGGFKVGLELGTAEGWRSVHGALEHYRVAPGAAFADLKLHDIPNTVESTARVIAGLPLYGFITVHASGGRKMIAAARAGAATAKGERPKILAVTVLTSLNDDDLAEQGISATTLTQVVRLGKMAIEAGADGLICSPHEVVALRQVLGDGPLLVTPGIRLPESGKNDQERVGSPFQAIENGSSRLVIGRPIMDRSVGQRAAVVEKMVINIMGKDK